MRIAAPLASALALAAGLLLPGVPGAVGLFLAAGVVPGLALGAWLLPAAAAWTRAVVGLALGPLVASVVAIGPFAAGVAPLPLVVGLAVLGGLGLAGAPRPAPGAGPGIDAPASRATALFALAVVLAFALPPLAHEWGRVKSDGWIHAGIVREILERGVPPQDPRWAGQVLNYVWMFNFFIALLAGTRGGDPFTFMVLLNLTDLLVVLGLVHLIAWTVWRDGRVATGAVVLTVLGLNAGAWILWPLRALRGLTGSVHGAAAVREALAAPDLTSWRVFYELAAPFAHMVSFIDKFTIGTALNQAWVQMLLVLWSTLAWLAGGPRPLLALAAAGALGMLLFHGVVGLSVIPVLGLTLLVALVARRGGMATIDRRRLVAAGIALAAGALAGVPYTRSISRGWSAGQTGVAHSFLALSPMMAWTVLTACGIVLALASRPARRMLRAGPGAGSLLVLFTLLMAGFAIVVNLPEDNESKFAFQVFFPAAVLAAGALEPAILSARARLGGVGAAGLACALFGLPFVLTLVALTVDVAGRAAPHANLSVAERRFHAALRELTPADAVIVDAGFRDYAMVLAGRQLYCGSSAGPSRAGFPAAEVAERQAVMADLYGPAADLPGDGAKLARLGRPVYVVYREADFPDPADRRVLDRVPTAFRRVHDDSGFVVYSLLPRPEGEPR